MAVFPQGSSAEDVTSRGFSTLALLDENDTAYSCSEVCRHHADQCNAAGDELGGGIYKALADILRMHLVPRDHSVPFRPFAIFEDRRSLALEDLIVEDYELLEAVVADSPAPIIRGRLADVCWVGGRNVGRKAWHLGPVAAAAYLEAAQAGQSPDAINRVFDELTRGLQLAWEFRKQSPGTLAQYWVFLAELANRAATDEDLNLLIRTARLFAERKPEQTGDIANLAEAAAVAATEKGASPSVADLWEIVASLWHALKETDRARHARLQQGEVLVAIGELTTDSAMGAVHWIQQGLETLRRAKADPDRIEAVHRRLVELGEKQLGEMGQISTDFDATEIIAHARKSVSNLPLKDALIRYAFSDQLLDPEKLRRQVEEQVKNNPLQYLIEARVVSRDGKTVAIRPSLMAEGEEYERAISLAVIDHASRFEVSFRAQLNILPARDQIWNDHHPSYADLSFLVNNNPFVPPGHEEAYLRGFVAGFLGDWVVASHLLIPQVEASVRHVLNKAGAMTSNLQADGTQEEKKLHQLLEMPEAFSVFGQPLVFELRMLLIEALGGNLRNQFAHGLLSDGDCYSFDVFTLWWLLLRICLTPIAMAEARSKADSPDDQSTETPSTEETQ